MKISRIIIQNFRNLRNIDIHLNDTVALIGENNSGKSNFLRAVTLPFLSDEIGSSEKSLSRLDINNDAKNEYYNFILHNQEKIKDGTISLEECILKMPVVAVEVHLVPNEKETYFVKDLSFDIDSEQMVYGLRYEFRPSKPDKIYDIIKSVTSKKMLDSQELSKYKMNLLPMECYSHSIFVPRKNTVPLIFLSHTSIPRLRLKETTSLNLENELAPKPW